MRSGRRRFWKRRSPIAGCSLCANSVWPPTAGDASHTQQDIWTRYCIGLLSNCHCDGGLGHRGGSYNVYYLVATHGFNLVSRRDRRVYQNSRQERRPNEHPNARVYGDARWLAVSRGLFAVVGISAGALRACAAETLSRLTTLFFCASD